MDAGEDVPDHLADPPSLNPWAARYWRAFVGTDGDRPVGMAAGSIPSGAIIQWMRDVEGETECAEIARAVRMVRAIDDESWPLRREKKSDGDAG
jgi:hypothetical protein